MVEQGKILQQRYRIERQIGQGGMGAVYVATDLRFGSTVAIKETLCPGENYQKAIEREARLLNSLKHPALPRVTDHFTEYNRQFLVMEYVDGEDLVHMLERMGRPFSFALVLHWADQILDALHYLHGQQIPVIHRDIKPHNLKITPQGNVMLLDFGLAKGNPTDVSHQTEAKSVFGYSKNYASLEQIQGTGTDPRSDLYSLAATLYHLATGQPPVDALTRAMRVLGRHPDPLVPAHRVRSEVPAGFAGLLSAAMQLDAASRPASAARLRAMLKAYTQFEHLAISESVPLPLAANGPIEAETHVRQTPLQSQSAVATEVMPANLSQATSLRASAFTVGLDGDSATKVAAAVPAKRSGRKFVIAAGALALLFIVGSVAAAAIYFVPEALFGRGKAIDGRQGQADRNGEGDPLDSGGGTRGRSSDQPPQGTQVPPNRPPEVAPPPPQQPSQQQQPDRANIPPAPVAEPPSIPSRPAGRQPKSGDTAKSAPPAPPKGKKPGIRVDSIEIERLPGGFRGVKITRDRREKQDQDKDDGGGLKITKFPNIFRKIPSKLRELADDDDRPRKRPTTRQD